MPGQQRMQEEKNVPGGDGFSVSPPTISSPKGGGAIRGIGEKFTANPVTGTGSLTVPIAASPGRSGFSPQLSLAYDSGAGNGPFGFGWSLSLPSITRKTDKGLPRYLDGRGQAPDSDVFILSGAEDLVPEFEKDSNGEWIIKGGNYVIYDKSCTVGGSTYLIRRYRPRIEGLFARIERWTNQTDPADVFWRSISKDNITTWYGKSAESRIADPADLSRIFSWLISESYDDKGNAIIYEYVSEDSANIDISKAHEWNRSDRSRSANRYLKRIKYANLPSSLVEPDLSKLEWLFEVVFDYDENHYKTLPPDGSGYEFVQVQNMVKGDDKDNDRTRSWTVSQDHFSTYRAGFEVCTYRLCRRVLMFHHFKDELGVDDYLVRSTEFTYSESPIASFISSITQSGYVLSDGVKYLKKSLPPLQFKYSPAEIDPTVREVDAESLENLPSGVDGSRYQWVDLDGEGLSGILTEQADAWYYKPSLGGGKFGALETVALKPSLAALGSGRQQFMSLAGDGRLDLVEFSGPVPGFYKRTEDQSWEQFRNFVSLPNITWNNPNLKFVDLDGDGHADILLTEDNVFTWYRSLAEDGFDDAERVPQAFDEEIGPRLVFADGTQSVYLTDFSGDGLSDLVRIRNGEVCYWPNLGYGKFGAKVTMDNSPWFDAPDLFDQKRVRLADIDGSGTVDIIYLEGRRAAVYLNQCGNGWSDPEYLNSLPSIDNLSSVVATDLLGNGTACLVWSSPLPGDRRRPVRYIDLMGGQKPHLLINVKNNLGAETSVQYAPSTKFYLQDKLGGAPWITRLPFPVYCVEKVTLLDNWRNTKFTTTYSYHHGYYDGTEREFRGFGRVEHIDVEDFGKFTRDNAGSPYITSDQTLYQPPVKTVTWYHTGAYLDQSRILSHFSDEYFPNGFPDVAKEFSEHSLPEPNLEGASLTPEEWREGLRSCKGMVLRQEVYELDVDVLEAGLELPIRLFTTAFHNWDIRLLQPMASNRHAVFHPTESEAITYHYELDLQQTTLTPDPRIAHTLNLNIDDYGNVLQSVAVVYQRTGEYSDSMLTADQNELIKNIQQERHLSYTENHYTNDIDDDIDEPNNYRLRLLCEATIYELTGINPQNDFYFSIDELCGYQLSDIYQTTGIAVKEINYQDVFDPSTPQKRPAEQRRTLFFAENLKDPLDFGNLNALGIPFETYKLALTDDLLNAIYGDKLTPDVTNNLTKQEISGYLNPSDALARFGSSAKSGEYWIPSGIAGFGDNAGANFYLPERYADSFRNPTSIQHDTKYYLYIASTTDPVGNTVTVEQFDFRVLAPGQIRDINNNLSGVYFDALGLPTAIALMGKGNEGDSLDGFDDTIANPGIDTLTAFFTGNYDEAKAREFLGQATARYVYYFGEKKEDGTISYENHPSCACGILREKHLAQLGAGESTPLHTAFEYSDGMGTVLVKKAQAEPDENSSALRWIATGKTILNNKGKPVKQYEPYFSQNEHRFEEADEAGVTPIMYYDAVGRLIRTDSPDGTFSRVNFTTWQVETWDANDTVLESSWYKKINPPDPNQPLPTDPLTGAITATAAQRTAWLAAQHANTPAMTILDSLGRDVITVAYNKYPDSAGQAIAEKYLTFTKLDAEGKPLWMCDDRKNLVVQYTVPLMPEDSMHKSGRKLDEYDNGQNNWQSKIYAPCYDIAHNLLNQHSMDAGDRWVLNDAAGKPMYVWEKNNLLDDTGTAIEENRVFFTAYDALHRPVVHQLLINADEPQLIEKFLYGEEVAGVPDTSIPNLHGQLYQHFDQSGLKTVVSYDFKGNVLEVKRQLACNYKAAVVDWQDGSSTAGLETEIFSLITEYDALNRMTRLFNWHRDTGSRVAVYVPSYNKRGLLDGEELIVRAIKTAESQGYTTDNSSQQNTPMATILYNAKGQREKVKYGNSTITRYYYDPETFRLDQLRTTRPGYDPNPFPSNDGLLTDEKILQNLFYTYDPVGNITEISDDAFEPAFFSNQQVDAVCRYIYDALYRLISATGRENYQATQAPGQYGDAPFPVQFPVNDPKALRNYTQTYSYDSVGNINQIKHVANGGSWTRNYGYDDCSNRLSSTWLGNDRINAVQYQYDERGNMRNLANTGPASFMNWNYRDMIQRLNLGGGGQVYYDYDADKQRTRKVNEAQNGSKQWERIYLGGLEIYRRYKSSGLVEEIETVHLMEGDKRLLLIEDVKQTDNGNLTVGPHYLYQYGNHLGSAVLELDENAQIISYEEYHPYGTTAYQATNSNIQSVAKRYRYTSKERDEESGLYYHGARYYAPWLGKWVSCDPAYLKAGTNLFQYAFGNPISFFDPDGAFPTAGEIANKWESSGLNPLSIASPIAFFANSFGITGEKLTQTMEKYVDKGLNALLDRVPQGGGTLGELNRLAANAQVTAFKTVATLVIGGVATVVDPGSAIRGIMHIGEGAAAGVENIKKGNTTLGISQVVGDASQAILTAVPAIKGGLSLARRASVPAAPPAGNTNPLAGVTNAEIDAAIDAAKSESMIKQPAVKAQTKAFVPSSQITLESQQGWKTLNPASLSEAELNLTKTVVNAENVVVGRSVNIKGMGTMLDTWLSAKGIKWSQRWQDVYNRALFERTSSGKPVNVLGGGGYTLGEVDATEAGAAKSGIHNQPFWPQKQ